MPKQMVLASSNAGKLAELKEALLPLGWEIRGLEGLELPEETGDTFEANALIKARAAAQAFGLPALADDSGLCVHALGGAPGVYSARYGGKESDGARNAYLLSEMEHISERGAHFVCVLALVTPRGEEHTFGGELHGEILREARGGGGFGYDPLFGLADGRSLAELSRAEKEAVSHRGQAVRALLAFLDNPALANPE